MAFVRGHLALCTLVLLAGCSRPEPANPTLYEGVDSLFEAVSAEAQQFTVVAEIDHSRLAAEEGEVMPPARVILFSDPAVNTPIVQLNPLAGLDLPFRVLSFADGDSPAVIATPAEFLALRHGLPRGPELERFQAEINRILAALPEETVMHYDLPALGEGAGMVRLESPHGFEETIERLKTDILAEGDTTWFGEVDYQADAAALGVSLPRLTLMLWGAPAPGAKAMVDIPRMGLDAFCQKTLVYESAEGAVLVYYNDMPYFAELHQGKVALPHRVISRRMGATLEGALE